MRIHRWIPSLGAVVMTCGSPTWAQDKLEADLQKLYGGFYSTQCNDTKATRLRVDTNALVIDEQGRRMTGRNVQVAQSFFGPSAPPEYRVALRSEVRDGLQLFFIVYRDRSGQYIKLDGDPEVNAALGRSLLTRKYYSCDPDKNVPLAQTVSTQQGGSAADAIYGPRDLLNDPKFKVAYFRGLGSRSKERWLSELDGPAPEIKKVKVAGTDYILASVCKPHDCGDNNTVILYSAVRGAVYAKIFEGGTKSTLIGAPPPDVVSELERLWRSEWRQNR